MKLPAGGGVHNGGKLGRVQAHLHTLQSKREE